MWRCCAPTAFYRIWRSARIPRPRRCLPKPSPPSRTPGSFAWIHRRIDAADVYFVANLRNASTAGQFTFRIQHKQPELWDAVTGEIRSLPEYTFTEDGRTLVPLEFAPRQSFFVVFQRLAAKRADPRRPCSRT